MKVALYARVSKSDVEAQDPENQLIRLRKYAQEKGYDIYEEYVDRASGADASRPALDKMLRDARGNRFSTIAVVRLDRLARSMPNLYALVDELTRNRVKFHCVDQPEVSTDSAMGKIVLAVLGAVAEFERELISDRTKDGLEKARQKGKKIGRRPVEIDFERVTELKAQGWGIKRIAADLGIAPETLRRGLTKGVENPKGENPENEGAKQPGGC